ncbi:MAG: dihydropteroate synthase [Polyangiaceae bacterium]|jgi:dihydropteroate synthase|nr:dihydropteroate synthase [Polyangiaceae bacterium]MBK8940295.1 dihydropteroate synthase [Polyangiaceae bacterium]
MGVLNCTPDSFSDGGQYLDERRALEHAESMLEEGATIIDVGAESTRPGARRVPPEEQARRLGGVVRALAARGVVVSIDTTSPEVAARALDDGAELINSVELGPAGQLAEVARSRGAALALMHSLGSMADERAYSSEPAGAYGDVVADVKGALSRARDQATAAGLSADDVLLDPGLGFHKSARHSLELCAHLDELVALGHPVLVGPSRKSFLAAVLGGSSASLPPPRERLGATIAACLLCARRGAAVLRVHDPREVQQALSFEQAAQHV